jgi:hypothetical protein
MMTSVTMPKQNQDPLGCLLAGEVFAFEAQRVALREIDLVRRQLCCQFRHQRFEVAPHRYWRR